MNVRASKFLAWFIILAVFTACDGGALHDAAQDLNSRCPLMVDSETRLDAVTAAGDSVISYHFSLINADRANADTAGLRRALWPGLLSHVRVDQSMQKLRDDRVTIRYYYNDKHGQHLVAFTFTEGDYL